MNHSGTTNKERIKKICGAYFLVTVIPAFIIIVGMWIDVIFKTHFVLGYIPPAIFLLSTPTIIYILFRVVKDHILA